ncbi:MAG TPA: FAD-binding protein, partial [Jatrophihabitantaceae bacterium]|nr:FAD-binding protein [Jatrophihabitantaceae bacterium]
GAGMRAALESSSRVRTAVLTKLYPTRAHTGAAQGGMCAALANVELYAWLFMRISGIVLVVLVLGHLFIMNILDGGVQRINWAFVAGRWASPFWQVWDLLMLWLAMIHGASGLRTIINDYTRRDGTRLVLKSLLYTATTITIALGTLVIFTFDPSI